MQDEYDDEDDDGGVVALDFTMRPWQLELHNKLKRYNVLVIHRGAGKTVLALMELVMRALSGPSHAQYLFLGPLKNQMMRNVWEPLKKMVEPIPGMYINNNRLEVVFPHKARISVLGADDPDNLRGMHVHGMVIDEFGDCPAATWPIVFPMTTNHNAWVLFIGTPKGRNAFYDKYMEAVDPANSQLWFGQVLDYSQTKALPPENIEVAKKTMSADFFAQEYLCSWEASNRGAYYAKQIAELRANGRITYDDLYRPDLLTHCCFDIGRNDATAIWWFQIILDPITREHNVNFIDFECNVGTGLAETAEIVRLREQNFGYKRGKLIMPHDIRVHEWGAQVDRLSLARQAGMLCVQCPPHTLEDGIEIVRRHLPQCRFDARKCEDGIESLAQYKAKLDKYDNAIGPLHDKNSDPADSLRYGIAYVFQVMCKPQLMMIPKLRQR